MTLFPTKFENGKIEYKIRYKGRSRPFSRAKALVTSEQSRDPTKLKELLSQVLTITLDGDKGASSTDSSIELETGQLDRVPQLDQRMEESDAEGYVYSEESESERLREERRTKKRNDPISSESEQGEFEIGVNLVQEEVIKRNQDEPMEEAEQSKKEDELPMYQEHYNALFSMDFVETKYPHDDTMRGLGIFEDVELVLKNMH
ncbi:unnamed protein product, partial [Microthlaspi erraticum]